MKEDGKGWAYFLKIGSKGSTAGVIQFLRFNFVLRLQCENSPMRAPRLLKEALSESTSYQVVGKVILQMKLNQFAEENLKRNPQYRIAVAQI
jgi:hypothetical protein